MQGGSRETLQATFETDTVVLKGYPFHSARNRGRRLRADECSELCVGWFPPALRTKDGEFLFVTAKQADQLADFAVRNSIPFMDRFDVWEQILEEFLDTEFDDDDQARTLRRLAENGVSEAEVREMRRLVRVRMLALTFVTWEWFHYGLYDVLSQMAFCTFLSGWSFPRFYEHAMALANRGHATPSTKEAFLRPFTREKKA